MRYNLYMRYYISDLHFYHINLLTKMDCRGFDSVEQMNEYMIERWNSKIKKNDEVIILGDLSFGNGKQTSEIVNRLKGRLFLIRGNHDDRYLKDKEFDASRFEWIKDYEEMHDNNRKVILCHYPIICYNGQYRIDANGSAKAYMLYGHVHDTRDEKLIEQFCKITTGTRINPDDENDLRTIPCQMINCFCMYSDYQPLTLDEWIELDKKRKEANL